MPNTTPLSETSQAIARYLVEQGTNPFSTDGAQKDYSYAWNLHHARYGAILKSKLEKR